MKIRKKGVGALLRNPINTTGNSMLTFQPAHTLFASVWPFAKHRQILNFVSKCVFSSGQPTGRPDNLYNKRLTAIWRCPDSEASLQVSDRANKWVIISLFHTIIIITMGQPMMWMKAALGLKHPLYFSNILQVLYVSVQNCIELYLLNVYIYIYSLRECAFALCIKI